MCSIFIQCVWKIINTFTFYFYFYFLRILKLSVYDFYYFFTFLGAEASNSFFVVKTNYQKLVPHQEMTSGGKLSNEGKDPTYCRQNMPTFSVQRKSKMLCFRHTVGKIKVKIRKQKFTLCNIHIQNKQFK